jgi:hypothetical protein
MAESPYKRATYRYTPLLAYMLVPNVWIHPAWGKFVSVHASCHACASIYLGSCMCSRPRRYAPSPHMNLRHCRPPPPSLSGLCGNGPAVRILDSQDPRAAGARVGRNQSRHSQAPRRHLALQPHCHQCVYTRQCRGHCVPVSPRLSLRCARCVCPLFIPPPPSPPPTPLSLSLCWSEVSASSVVSGLGTRCLGTRSSEVRTSDSDRDAPPSAAPLSPLCCSLCPPPPPLGVRLGTCRGAPARRPVWCGVLLALAVHVKLYPIIYALPLYLAVDHQQPSAPPPAAAEANNLDKPAPPERLHKPSHTHNHHLHHSHTQQPARGGARWAAGAVGGWSSRWSSKLLSKERLLLAAACAATLLGLTAVFSSLYPRDFLQAHPTPSSLSLRLSLSLSGGGGGRETN